MKKIWVFRHGPKESGAGKNVIAPEMALKNPEGIELVKMVAEKWLVGEKFRTIYTSPLVRAYQTGVIFSQTLGMDYPAIVPRLAGLDLTKWEKIMPVLKSYTCVAFYEAAPTLIRTDGGTVFKLITLAAKYIGPDEQAICVSHGGLIEPAMATAISSLTGRDFGKILSFITDLKEGEAVIFFFDDENNFADIKEKRLA